MSDSQRIWHLKNQQAQYLSQFIGEQLALPSEKVIELLSLGAIYVDKERCNKDKIIAADSYVRVHTQPKRFNLSELEWDKVHIFSNDDFVVINKPAGIPCHALLDNESENLLKFTSTQLRKKAYITHRLDTMTHGLMVYALSHEYQKIFNSYLQKGLVEKTYVAIVQGASVEAGELVHFMVPSIGSPKEVSFQEQKGWLKCQLQILSSIQISVDCSYLKIRLLTGRTHQIRAQLSAIGHPIIGDVLYGASAIQNSPHKIALWAESLKFPQSGSGDFYDFSLQINQELALSSFMVP